MKRCNLTLNIFLLMLVSIFGALLFGCSKDEKINWKSSATFIKDNIKLYGTKGKFGMIKVNGKVDEPEFPVNQGRLYDIYFLDDSIEVNGKKFKIMGIHEDMKDSLQLYEWGIDNNKSGAKISLDKVGLWKLTVTVDEKFLTSFVINAE